MSRIQIADLNPSESNYISDVNDKVLAAIVGGDKVKIKIPILFNFKPFLTVDTNFLE